MVHVPIRGLFLLTRAAAVVVAAAAIPVMIKHGKPIAKKIGDELEKFGKWLQEGDEEATPKSKAATKAEKPSGTAAKPAEAKTTTKAAAKTTATKSAAKKPAPRKRTTRAKPKPKPPTA